MEKSYVAGTWEKTRAFSPAVIVTGGKMIFVAGHGGQVDDAGKSLAGDFDAQTRQTFRNIEKTLKEAGAGLKNLVTMTVFITDSRYGMQFTDIRLEVFKENFPASALITCDGLARTDMLVEVQGIAMIA